MMPETAPDQIAAAINNKQSFLVEAGAGSGKTWSLIETLKYILNEEASTLEGKDRQITCITYTNIAKDEIINRIDNNPLVFVGTIHEFLWHVMKNYQTELKKAILDFNAANERNPVGDLETKIKDVTVTYSQYGRNFERGQITHNDVIEFSSKLFEAYPKIAKIVASKYPYIFVDEYQDTEKRTVDLLLDQLLRLNSGKVVIGFFGDSMQKIYEQGVGAINDERLQTITKQENFRCSLTVIQLLNNIRPTLQQVAAGHNVQGEALVFCGTNSNNSDYGKVFNYLTSDKGWQPTKTKVLMLTHKGIAGKLDYPNLLSTYDTIPFYRDRLLKSDEEFSIFFQKIEDLIFAYDTKKYGDFIQLLGKEGFRFSKHQHKREIKEQVEHLKQLRASAKIKDVFAYLFQNGLLTKPQSIEDFETDISRQPLPEEYQKKKEFYDSLMDVSYQEVVNIYQYIKEQTPFSTKHGVKGAEYENVLVVIEDGVWPMYNFNDVFSGNQRNLARYQRTLNLLYVCCSRAKNRLALLTLSSLDSQAMSTLRSWFEAENVHQVSTLQ